MTTFTEDYEAPLEELPEDELTPEFVRSLIDRCMEFMEVFVGHPLHPYQTPFARRIIESVLINDGEELSAQASRQSGKSEVVADTVVTLMVLLPRLAKMYPDLLGRFSNGIWIGLFAPVEGQVETLFSRVMTRLTSERAQEIMGDPEIDDEASKAGGVVRTIRLKKSGSLVSMMTANPKAKIESRTFHLIILDEAQGSADQIVAKSLGPMLAYNAGTLVKTGTPATLKNNFYQTIQRNKRRQTGRGSKQNHFEWDWREVAKVNPNYGKFVKKEMLRIGEDSDEFQMSYCTVPETRILTADMRHIPAGDITVGMKLVGFDEERPGKGQHRRLQESVVEDVGRIMRPCYRLTLSDGTSITCSSEHRWLVTTAGRRTEWKMAEDLVSTDRIFKVTDVWEHTEDYRTGYLAAAFEGEGHFSRHSMLGFSQRDNPMMLKVRKYLEELNFSTWEVTGSGTNEDVTVLHVGGGRSEVMRFLGQVRPERLLDKVDVGQFGTIGRHYKEPDQFQHPYVLNSEFVGEREVVAIKTSTKTYIAEGLASHNCVRWILERGMFVTEGVMEQLSDRSMEVVKHWHKSPVVVGIDPARKLDSTVVTVVWVDWDRPDDEFGYYDHRVLNWLELQGEDWEQQYAEITDFLANYDVLAVAVDANGVGDAVAQRLKLLLPRAEVIPVTSSMSEQSARFKHLQALIQRKMIGFPGHCKDPPFAYVEAVHAADDRRRAPLPGGELHGEGTGGSLGPRRPRRCLGFGRLMHQGTGDAHHRDFQLSLLLLVIVMSVMYRYCHGQALYR